MARILTWAISPFVTALLLVVYLLNRNSSGLGQWFLAIMATGTMAMFVRYGLLYLWQAAAKAGKVAA